MKHLLLIVCAAVVSYSLWTVAGKAKRKNVLDFLSRHAPRLIVFATLLFIALAAAVSFSSISIL